MQEIAGIDGLIIQAFAYSALGVYILYNDNLNCTVGFHILISYLGDTHGASKQQQLFFEGTGQVRLDSRETAASILLVGPQEQ